MKNKISGYKQKVLWIYFHWFLDSLYYLSTIVPNLRNYSTYFSEQLFSKPVWKLIQWLLFLSQMEGTFMLLNDLWWPTAKELIVAGFYFCNFI